MEQLASPRPPGRPTEFGHRVTKAVRLEPSLDERLKLEARMRNVSANLLINRAVEDFLDRLVPVDEAVKTAS